MDLYSATWAEAREDNDQPPPNGFATGEDAGDVKLTLREIMAACRREWDASHPTLTTGGNGDQLTLTPIVPITGYADGQIFAAKLNADLGAAGTANRTLTISGKGERKLFLPRLAGGYAQTAQSGKEAKAGQAVFFAYASDLDSGAGGFIVYAGAPQQPAIEAIEVPLTGDALAPHTGALDLFSFRLPYRFKFTDFRSSLVVAQTSGSLVSLNVYYLDPTSGRHYIVASAISIDNGETSSVTASAPYQVGGVNGGPLQGVPFPDDTEISFLMQTVGDGTARGLKVTLYGYRA